MSLDCIHTEQVLW